MKDNNTELWEYYFQFNFSTECWEATLTENINLFRTDRGNANIIQSDVKGIDGIKSLTKKLKNENK